MHTKEPDTADRRSSILRLSREGERALGELSAELDVNFVRPAQPAEITLFNDMFHVIMEHMRSR
ncbi:MAG: hypothetical protein IJO87_09430 [Eggerthellaceae bacterium]|nr:hypothetical protein [Eggerthellaceae bacterium]